MEKSARKLILWKRVQLTGTLLIPRSDAYKAELTAKFASQFLTLFENEKNRPVVDEVHTLTDIQKAHERMESNQNIGKIIIRI